MSAIERTIRRDTLIFAVGLTAIVDLGPRVGRMKRMKTLMLGLLVGVALLAPRVLAHEMTFEGTVFGIEPARIQVKTGEERQGQEPVWFAFDAKTQILRGKKAVSFDEAKIQVGEEVTIVVLHESNAPLQTLEIRLADRTAP